MDLWRRSIPSGPLARSSGNTKYKGVITTEARDVAGTPLDQNATTSGLAAEGVDLHGEPLGSAGTWLAHNPERWADSGNEWMFRGDQDGLP